MNTHPSGATAKIYQFPIGGRAALNARRDGIAAHEQAREQVASRVSASAFGSWYHDAAIEEARRPSEH